MVRLSNQIISPVASRLSIAMGLGPGVCEQAGDEFIVYPMVGWVPWKLVTLVILGDLGLGYARGSG